jgi:hypothetical protein
MGWRAGVVATLAMIVAAPAGSSASIEQATGRLFDLIGRLRAQYPALRDRSEYGAGMLNPGETMIYRERLLGGTTYVLVAVGCDTATDIDLGVFDVDGTPLEVDADADQSAAVSFTPKANGQFVVGVHMTSTVSGDAAHFAYQVFYVETER